MPQKGERKQRAYETTQMTFPQHKSLLELWHADTTEPQIVSEGEGATKRRKITVESMESSAPQRNSADTSLPRGDEWEPIPFESERESFGSQTIFAWDLNEDARSLLLYLVTENQ